MDVGDDTCSRAAYEAYCKALIATGLTIPMEFGNLPKAIKSVWVDVANAVIEAERLMERGR